MCTISHGIGVHISGSPSALVSLPRLGLIRSLDDGEVVELVVREHSYGPYSIGQPKSWHMPCKIRAWPVL